MGRHRRITQENHRGVLVQVILTGSQKAEPQRGVGGRAAGPPFTSSESQCFCSVNTTTFSPVPGEVRLQWSERIQSKRKTMERTKDKNKQKRIDA